MIRIRTTAQFDEDELGPRESYVEDFTLPRARWGDGRELRTREAADAVLDRDLHGGSSVRGAGHSAQNRNGAELFSVGGRIDWRAPTPRSGGPVRATADIQVVSVTNSELDGAAFRL